MASSLGNSSRVINVRKGPKMDANSQDRCCKITLLLAETVAKKKSCHTVCGFGLQDKLFFRIIHRLYFIRNGHSLVHYNHHKMQTLKSMRIRIKPDLELNPVITQLPIHCSPKNVLHHPRALFYQSYFPYVEYTFVL